jgi:cell division protein FtsQ
MEQTPTHTTAPRPAKKRWKRIFAFFLLFLMLGAVGTLMGFVHIQRNKQKCLSVDVKIQPNNGSYFLSVKTILQAVNGASDSLTGTPLDELDIGGIHNRLKQNPWIEEAHVYSSVDGRCVVEVKQRTPIARIIGSDGSNFYLDAEGYIMPASRLGTARVPVITGEITEPKKLPVSLTTYADSALATPSIWDDVFVLCHELKQHEFMNAQTEHIVVSADGKFNVVPRLGDHIIKLGAVDHLPQKFKKLLTFYANTVNQKDLNSYRSINLEYHNQVVCQRYN